jgi:hypothetical protein
MSSRRLAAALVSEAVAVTAVAENTGAARVHRNLEATRSKCYARPSGLPATVPAGCSPVWQTRRGHDYASG